MTSENDTTYGNYQKIHEENFLKMAENRARKIIPIESELPKELIQGGNTLSGNGLKVNLYLQFLKCVLRILKVRSS